MSRDNTMDKRPRAVCPSTGKNRLSKSQAKSEAKRMQKRGAECDDHASLGLALVTMAEDNREAELPAEMFGIRDAWNRRWISIPFLPRDATPFQ